jgi:hypothetical protein
VKVMDDSWSFFMFELIFPGVRETEVQLTQGEVLSGR